MATELTLPSARLRSRAQFAELVAAMNPCPCGSTCMSTASPSVAVECDHVDSALAAAWIDPRRCSATTTRWTRRV